MAVNANVAGALMGQRVVITGKVEGYDRYQAGMAAARAGAIVQDKVTRDTTLLVIGDKPGSSKLTAASAYGVVTITEAEFRERIA